MDTTSSKPPLLTRPAIESFDDPVEFMADMIRYRKASDANFSVVQATKDLRRISPALVSLVLKKKRKLTLDRVDEFAKLLGLSAPERHFLKEWIGGSTEVVAPKSASGDRRNRKEVSTHILKDWLNVYVKDLFQFEEIQKSPQLAEKVLVHIATPKRVRASVQFLLREGYLRKTMDGRTVLETELAVADPKIPSQKIRQFHKASLALAQKAIDRVPPSERYANSLVVPLNEASYGELVELIS
ncbi:MAG: DUF4423 domain-containing protein, partial [Proteobacteria bacterium]